jgi:hypothetical protein
MRRVAPGNPVDPGQDLVNLEDPRSPLLSNLEYLEADRDKDRQYLDGQYSGEVRSDLWGAAIAATVNRKDLPDLPIERLVSSMGGAEYDVDNMSIPSPHGSHGHLAASPQQ